MRWKIGQNKKKLTKVKKLGFYHISTVSKPFILSTQTGPSLSPISLASQQPAPLNTHSTPKINPLMQGPSTSVILSNISPNKLNALKLSTLLTTSSPNQPDTFHSKYNSMIWFWIQHRYKSAAVIFFLWWLSSSRLQLKFLFLLLDIGYNRAFFVCALFSWVDFGQALRNCLECLHNVVPTLGWNFQKPNLLLFTKFLSFLLLDFPVLFNVIFVAQHKKLNIWNCVFFDLCSSSWVLIEARNHQCPCSFTILWYHRRWWLHGLPYSRHQW